MQRWEYCLVTGMSVRPDDVYGVYPRLVYLTGKGSGVEKIGKSSSAVEGQALAMTVAKLGDKGWEMVGVTMDMHGVYTLFFKRPSEA